MMGGFGYLKQSKMHEMKNELRSTEPKVLIGPLHERNSLDHGMFLRDFKSHPSQNGLKF